MDAVLSPLSPLSLPPFSLLPSPPSLPFYFPPLHQRHTLNLHIHPQRQRLDRHTAPCRQHPPLLTLALPLLPALPSKPALILGIELLEVTHVRQEGVDLDDPVEGGAGRFEDGADVGDAGGRLGGDGAGDEGAGGEGGDLAGEEEEGGWRGGGGRGGGGRGEEGLDGDLDRLGLDSSVRF